MSSALHVIEGFDNKIRGSRAKSRHAFQRSQVHTMVEEDPYDDSGPVRVQSSGKTGWNSLKHRPYKPLCDAKGDGVHIDLKIEAPTKIAQAKLRKLGEFRNRSNSLTSDKHQSERFVLASLALCKDKLSYGSSYQELQNAIKASSRRYKVVKNRRSFMKSENTTKDSLASTIMHKEKPKAAVNSAHRTFRRAGSARSSRTQRQSLSARIKKKKMSTRPPTAPSVAKPKLSQAMNSARRPQTAAVKSKEVYSDEYFKNHGFSVQAMRKRYNNWSTIDMHTDWLDFTAETLGSADNLQGLTSAGYFFPFKPTDLIPTELIPSTDPKHGENGTGFLLPVTQTQKDTPEAYSSFEPRQILRSVMSKEESEKQKRKELEDTDDESTDKEASAERKLARCYANFELTKQDLSDRLSTMLHVMDVEQDELLYSKFNTFSTNKNQRATENIDLMREEAEIIRYESVLQRCRNYQWFRVLFEFINTSHVYNVYGGGPGRACFLVLIALRDIIDGNALLVNGEEFRGPLKPDLATMKLIVALVKALGEDFCAGSDTDNKPPVAKRRASALMDETVQDDEPELLQRQDVRELLNCLRKEFSLTHKDFLETLKAQGVAVANPKWDNMVKDMQHGGSHNDDENSELLAQATNRNDVFELLVQNDPYLARLAVPSSLVITPAPLEEPRALKPKAGRPKTTVKRRIMSARRAADYSETPLTVDARAQDSTVSARSTPRGALPSSNSMYRPSRGSILKGGAKLGVTRNRTSSTASSLRVHGKHKPTTKWASRTTKNRPFEPPWKSEGWTQNYRAETARASTPSDSGTWYQNVLSANVENLRKTHRTWAVFEPQNVDPEEEYSFGR